MARVSAIRYWSFGDVTRVAVETQGDYKLFSDQIENPHRVYFDLNGLRPPAAAQRGIQTITVKDRILKQIRVAEVSPGKTRIVMDVAGPVTVVYSQLVNPDRLMIEVRPKSSDAPSAVLAHSSAASQQVDLASSPSGAIAPVAVPARSESEKSLSARLDSIPEKAGAAQKTTVNAADTVQKATPDVKQAEPSGDQIASTHAVTSTGPNEAPQLPLSITTQPAAATKTTVEPALPSSLIDSHEPSAPQATNSRKSDPFAAPAKRDSGGDRSLTRVLGLKLGRVVIDAGHGGHDTGTIGPNGLMEKDLVLDVALRLGKLIRQQLGADVAYTRSGDVFIPLEERTRIANREKADLFISIHANSSPEPSATGVETYYFNLTSDKTGLDLATRENASSVSSISDLNNLLHKAVLENKLEESREFAQRIQSSLWNTSVKMNTRSRDRGVRHAPFVVLIGATMPSILAEIGFVSNPHDERLLKRNDQRQKFAEALYKGISQYAGTLSHMQMARAGAE